MRGCVTCQTIASGASTSPTKRSIVPTPFPRCRVPPLSSRQACKTLNGMTLSWKFVVAAATAARSVLVGTSIASDLGGVLGARVLVCVWYCACVCVLTKLWPFLRPRGFALSVHDCARACRATPQSETCTRRVYAKVRKGPVQCVFFHPKSVCVCLFYCVFGLVPCFFLLK